MSQRPKTHAVVELRPLILPSPLEQAPTPAWDEDPLPDRAENWQTLASEPAFGFLSEEEAQPKPLALGLLLGS